MNAIPIRKPLLPAVRSTDLRATPESVPWLWQGFVARRNLTLLTSQWKTGKTTLLSLLLARRRDGGNLLGRPVTPGRTVVVSEEPQEHWERRHALLDFGDGVWFLCRPFAGQPRPEDWEALLGQLSQMHQEDGIDLAVIDPLASFLPPHAEGNVSLLLEALLPLQRLSTEGLAVLVLHHPRKGAWREGQAARGSGALQGCVDVLVEMNRVDARSQSDRRRRLQLWSRHKDTPAEVAAALNETGTDYEPADLAADALAEHWAVLRSVLAEALRKLTREQVLEQWPADHNKPGFSTLRLWLNEAAGRGLLCRDGSGTRLEPYRYWLAEREVDWLADPMYYENDDSLDELRVMAREAERQVQRMMGEQEAAQKAAEPEQQGEERPRKRKRKRRGG